MAEQTFRSPGFFEREIDLSGQEVEPTGTPAGVIGTAERGPAFIPVTVGSISDFTARFGDLDPERAGPYAVNEYLKWKDAVTFMRVLGAGSNDTSSEISNTRTYGIVSKAGFKATAKTYTRTDDAGVDHTLTTGQPVFLQAQHYISASVEGFAFPQFSDNSSFLVTAASASNVAYVTRAMILPSTGSRIIITDMTASTAWPPSPESTTGDDPINFPNNVCHLARDSSKDFYRKFRIIVSSSAGAVWANDDNIPGCRMYTASLNPTSDDYISRVLNTDPTDFQEKQHLLYLDFPVEHELAPIREILGGTAYSVANSTIMLCSGSGVTNAEGGQSDTYGNSFGRFDTRYTTPQTPPIISQPFGSTEYDLFHFETISDGAYGSDQLKISIANIRASTDENYPYSQFEVQVRKFGDSDEAKEVIETFPDVSLDPKSDRFIGKQIGDFKPRFNFDSLDLDEQRIVVSGKYPNISRYIRVVLNQKVYDGEVPRDATPFGFRGIPVLKTSDSMTDDANTVLEGRDNLQLGNKMKMDWIGSTDVVGRRVCGMVENRLSGSILPPLPLRFKVTKGNVPQTAGPYIGYPSSKERADSRLYWGTKYLRCGDENTVSNAGLNPNAGTLINETVRSYGKFQGIIGLDNLVTGTGADVFNDNKFTMARVALSTTAMTNLTGSAGQHMLEAAYLRDKYPESTKYTINDGLTSGRFTFATLIASSSVKFNRFTPYAKFTIPFFGGFDGLNILDKDEYYLNDKAAATDTGGKAGDSITGGLGLVGTDDGSMMGKGAQNNAVFSYTKAVNIMTDPLTVRHNLLAVPGIRDPFITDEAMTGVKAYSLAMYVMDAQHYDEDGNRLFLDNPKRPDVRETVEQFEGRRVDNNYTATYFPDVFIDDETNNRPVMVPSSVAAYGALAYNDSVAFPWFAPAGFNRGALGFVRNTEVRLTSGDRDSLYDARINPIANFPDGGFVIFGQKTLQITRSALDRVNVRRMLLEVKRQISNVAEQLLFEPNNANTRARFISQASPILSLIQAQSGIEKFSIVMDDTNNTQEDVEANKLNGRIVVVPTRAIEFIAIDFIITNAGVEFA